VTSQPATEAGTCKAAVPRFAGASGRFLGDSPVIDHVRHEWEECGRPATAVYEYACEHGHVRQRPTCDEHAPEPGAVGCRACWDDGHECPMTYREVQQ